MSSAARVSTIALVTAIAALGLSIAGTAATASANAPEKVVLGWNSPTSVLTLPSSDSFDDTIELGISSNESGTADLTATRLSGSGGASILSPQSINLSQVTPTKFTGSYDIGDIGVTVGSWELSVKVNGVTAKTVVKVGSGIAKTVIVAPEEKKLFPNTSNADDFTAEISAKDELGTSLPILSAVIDLVSSHHKHSVGGMTNSPSSETPGISFSTIAVDGWNTGVATATVNEVEGPTPSAHEPSGSGHVTLEDAELTTPSLDLSISTIYPNMHGYHNDLSITADVKNNTPDTQPLGTNSELEILHGTTEIVEEHISSSGPTNLGWGGTLSGVAAPGNYTARLTAQLVGGHTITRSAHFAVSAAEPVTKTVTVTYSPKPIVKDVVLTNAGGSCMASGSDVECKSVSGSSVNATGVFAVPSEVLKLASYIDYSASASVEVSHFSGTGTAYTYWGENGSGFGTTEITKNGATNSAVATAIYGYPKLFMEFELYNAISFKVSKVTIKYTYSAIG